MGLNGLLGPGWNIGEADTDFFGMTHEENKEDL